MPATTSSAELGRAAARCRASAAHLGRVQPGQRELVDQHFAVDHRHATSRAARRIDQRRPGVGVGREVRTIAIDEMRSARLPGSIDPISRFQPERAGAFARRHPDDVARSQRRRAPCASPGASRRDASRRTCRGGCCTRRRRRRATPRCRAPASRRPARCPDPSFRFEPGQCMTLTPRSAISACSASVTQTQCAVQRCGVARPVSARYSRFDSPPDMRADDVDLVADLRRVGVHEHAARVPTSAATASSSSREHDTAKRGANAARSRPFAAPSQRFCKRDALVDRRSRLLAAAARGTSLSESIMHLPTVARSPISASVSKTTSVSCTVSIVSTVVVPLRAAARRRRAAPRRAASPACARPPSARRAASATRAAACRRRSRGTASGTDGRASG